MVFEEAVKDTSTSGHDDPGYYGIVKEEIERKKNIFIARTSTAGGPSCTRVMPKGSTYVWHQTS